VVEATSIAQRTWFRHSRQRLKTNRLEELASVALLEHGRTSTSLVGVSSRLPAARVRPGILAELSGTLLPISSGMLDDRFDAERTEAEGGSGWATKSPGKAYSAGAAADIEALTRGS
jgi:hypothetical protein